MDTTTMPATKTPATTTTATKTTATATTAAPDRPADVPDLDTCPATIAQISLWFIDRLVPGAPIYNVARAFRVEGALDKAALAQALSQVVARHEALRTTFVSVNGTVHQVIHPPRPVVPRPIDLSATPPQLRLDAARQAAVAEADEPFDLEAGPLLRASLIEFGPEDHVLVLAMHHIVADGWSLVVLARELSAAYAALRSGGAAGLSPSGLQFGDFAAWEHERAQSPAFAEHLRYWCERVAGAPAGNRLEPDRRLSGPLSYQAATVETRLDPAAVRALGDLANQERATLFMATFSAFLVLLGRYQRSDDLVVGVPVAGRRPEFEDAVGYFVNTLPVRADLSGSPTFRELLTRVRETCLDAFAHGEVPLARIVEELNPARDLTRMPILQVIFQLISGFGQRGGGSGDEPELAGTTVSSVDLSNRYTPLDIEVQLVESDAGLDALWIYRADLFEHATVEGMSRQFEALLADLAANPDRPVADTEVATAAEKQSVRDMEARNAHLRVVDSNLQRSPLGVPGELVITGPATVDTVLPRPAETAVRLLPDPFASSPGARLLATGHRARYRRDGGIEILGPVESVAAQASAPVTAATAAPGDAADDLDQEVADVLAEVLGLDQIGIDDNFFDIGGHSILAIRAIIALGERFDIELPLRAIFDAPSVSQMSELIRAGGVHEGSAA